MPVQTNRSHASPRGTAFASILLIAIMAMPLSAQAGRWWLDAPGPAYQVLVYSFADSDGDGWGDFRGLTDRLDYLNDGKPGGDDLGVSALWLSPIHPASSYHGYDVLDYKAVSPRFGTMADFERLVDEAHARGVRIILDMVFNHTGSEHPWFLDARRSAASPYASWYRTETLGMSYGGGGMGRFYAAPRPDGTTFRYFSAFWQGMPDLNLDNTDVVNELKSVLAFWMEKGVDGFRFDAAKHAFDPHEIQAGMPSLALNKAFWTDLRRSARRVDADVYFIGEVLTGNVAEVAAYAGVFDGLFDFPAANLALEAAGRGTSGVFGAAYESIAAAYARAKGFSPAPLLTNHDQDRAASVLLRRLGADAVRGFLGAAGDAAAEAAAKALAFERTKLAASMVQTLPGLPFVYYGEELGMTGRRYRDDDVARRDAFPWSADRATPTVSWMPTAKLEAGQNTLTASADAQSGDPESILAHYRRLAALRAASPAVRSGTFARVPWSGFETATSVAWLRTSTAQKVLVVHNLDVAAFEIAVPAGVTLTALWTSEAGVLSGAATLPSGAMLSVAPSSSAVFVISE
ncbi:MAG: DUF3459 domain-containing protein [Spirochaetales bacterium]|nr:DUF3459 domain-containing protein [Spirochaetales bacterium]